LPQKQDCKKKSLFGVDFKGYKKNQLILILRLKGKHSKNDDKNLMRKYQRETHHTAGGEKYRTFQQLSENSK
jgi:hypothetical protein